MVHEPQFAAVCVDDLTGVPEPVAEDAFRSKEAEELVDVGWVVHSNGEFYMPAMAGAAIPVPQIACGATVCVRMRR
jgi:hypothetical protein